MSKTLGNGIPLSAAITSENIEKEAFEKGFYFYTTHANDPLPAAVGLKVIEIVMRDRLAERVRVLGERLTAGLLKLKEKHGCIGDVRGRGLLIGVEFVSDRITKEPAAHIGDALTDSMRELGLSANISRQKGAGRVIKIAPPLNQTDEELEESLAMFEEALRTTEGTMPLSKYIG
jgi:4-aminobutyrate aminotransferase-like enzyme